MISTDHSKLVQHLNTPIVLVGMMGVGKTSIGRILANALDLKLYDSDKIIEEKAGRSIKDVFKDFGEKKFRSSEEKTIKDLLKKKAPCIISTGGGAILSDKTRARIKKKSLSIWLQSGLERLYEQVSKSQNRPLLKTDNPKKTLESLMEEREDYYRQANIHFTVDQNSIDESAQELLQRMEEYVRTPKG